MVNDEWWLMVDEPRFDLTDISFFELDRLFARSAKTLKRRQQKRRRKEKRRVDGNEESSSSEAHKKKTDRENMGKPWENGISWDFMGFTIWLCQHSYGKWLEMVDFPIENGDFP